MSHHAFILLHPRDVEIALSCRAHMAAHGWNAHLLIDQREWTSPAPEHALHANYSTQGRGMYGNPCALAILEGIRAHTAPGDVVLKTDCDVWLSPKGNQWFFHPDTARAMRITYCGKTQPWGGIWSTTREHVEKAMEISSTFTPCGCPESYLNLKALGRTGAGLKFYPETTVTQWEPGKSRGIAATLPISNYRHRHSHRKALFTTPQTTAPPDQEESGGDNAGG